MFLYRALWWDTVESVLAAAVTAVGAIIVSAIQHRRTRTRNSTEHAENKALILELVADQRDMKADVREIKSTLRTFNDRIDRLEHA